MLGSQENKTPRPSEAMREAGEAWFQGQADALWKHVGVYLFLSQIRTQVSKVSVT